MKRGFIRFVAAEVGAYALHGLLGARPRRPLAAGPGPTVVFIHGHGGSGGGFAFLERALRSEGHQRFASWEYDARGTVEEVAARLAAWAERSIDGEVHVVGHSLGGILARAWLQEHGGRSRARSLVTLSTPHRGLGGLAAVPGAGLLPLVREVGAGSPLLARLDASAGVLAGLPCLSVVSARDHFVRPAANASFDGARLVTVQHVGHVGVLFSRRVHRLVAEHLRAATE